MAAQKRKKKNAVTLLGMTAVLVLLFGVYLLAAGWKSSQEEKEAANNAEVDKSVVLTEVDTSTLKTITVKSGEFSYEIAEGEEGWILNGDEEFPLNTAKVDNILTLLSAFTATRLVTESAENLDEYGLATPWMTVVAEGDAISTDICIGDQSSADGGYYTCLQGSRAVYLIDDSTRSILAQTEEDFVLADSIPSIDADYVTGLKVSSDSFADFTISERPSELADLTGRNLYTSYLYNVYEEPVPVDAASLAELADSCELLGFGDLVSYHQEELAQYGLETPATSVTIWYSDSTTGEAKEYTLYVGMYEEEEAAYYVRSEGSNQVFTMEQETLEALLLADTFSMISKYTQMVNITLLGGMEITYADTIRVFDIVHETKTDENGTESVTDYFTVDGKELNEEEETEDFRNLYQELIGIQLTAELVPEAAVLEKPVLRLVFQAAETKEELLTVSYLPVEGDDSCYAIEVNGTRLFTADAEAVDAVLTSLTEYQP